MIQDRRNWIPRICDLWWCVTKTRIQASIQTCDSSLESSVFIPVTSYSIHLDLWEVWRRLPRITRSGFLLYLLRSLLFPVLTWVVVFTRSESWTTAACTVLTWGLWGLLSAIMTNYSGRGPQRVELDWVSHVTALKGIHPNPNPKIFASWKRFQ